MNKTFDYKGAKYELFEIETVYLKEEEKNEYVGKILRNYIISFKYERLNLCMFRRIYRNCTKKQIDYLKSILEYNFEYELSDKQIAFLSKCSINEISTLISHFKNIEIEIIDKFDFKRDSEGNIIY